MRGKWTTLYNPWYLTTLFVHAILLPYETAMHIRGLLTKAEFTSNECRVQC